MLPQVRGLDEEPHPVAVGGLGPKPLSVSAPSSTRGAGPGGTASRLEAIKARLQAERAGSTGSRCGNAVLQSHSSRLVCRSSFVFKHSPMCGMQASIERITGPISSPPSWCGSHQDLWTSSKSYRQAEGNRHASNAIEAVSMSLQNHVCAPCRSRLGTQHRECPGCISSGGGNLTHQIWACLNRSSKQHCNSQCMCPQ